MRLSSLVACVVGCLGGCSFRPGTAPVSDGLPPSPDGALDAPGTLDASADAAPASFCAPDAHLRMCFSFDGSPLPALQANEGAAAVSAQLTNVTSIAAVHGNAAQLGATSEIYVAQGTGVTGILAAEIWFRYDSEPVNNSDRMGLYDSNVVPPNISLFFYRNDPSHTLRCGLGGQTETWDATLAPHVWYHAACLCDGANLRMFLDGVQVGTTRAGTCGTGGALQPDGLTIGSNNNGGPSGIDSQLLGAIDGIRLWDVAMSTPPP